MNHSLERLLDGIVETLRVDIIPKLEGEFVRGQAFGIIYALKSLKLRTSWSPAFLEPSSSGDMPKLCGWAMDYDSHELWVEVASIWRR